MVVDTSAVLAILFQEEDAAALAAAIEGEPAPLISAASVVEAGIVLTAREGPAAVDDLQAFIADGGLSVVAVTAAEATAAIDAFVRYGKGRHPAALNFGDCFAYALARTSGRPLLFKGQNFARTDLDIALSRDAD